MILSLESFRVKLYMRIEDGRRVIGTSRSTIKNTQLLAHKQIDSEKLNNLQILPD